MFLLLGLAITLFIIGFVIQPFLGGDIVNFINLPSVLMIILPLAGILTATQSFKIFSEGFMAAVLPKKEISEEVRGQAASLFRFLSKATAFIGLIMVCISWISILMGLDFSDSNAIHMMFVNIAASLVPMFYAVILIFAVFEPTVFVLKKRHEPRRK